MAVSDQALRRPLPTALLGPLLAALVAFAWAFYWDITRLDNLPLGAWDLGYDHQVCPAYCSS